MYLGENRKTKDKPLNIDHIESVVFDFPAMENLGFNSNNKEKATKELTVSIRLLHSVHADKKEISHNDNSKFNTPIFSGIKHMIVAKQSPLSRGN